MSAAERAEAVAEAAGQYPAGEVIAVRTRAGEVHIEAITVTEEDGHSVVEVRLAGAVEGGDPLFRIINPPTLVEDPAGAVEAHGKRWRVDPVGAVAEAIALNGGKRRRK